MSGIVVDVCVVAMSSLMDARKLVFDQFPRDTLVIADTMSRKRIPMVPRLRLMIVMIRKVRV